MQALGLALVLYFSNAFGYLVIHSLTKPYVTFALRLPLAQATPDERRRRRIGAIAQVQLFDHLALSAATFAFVACLPKTNFTSAQFSIAAIVVMTLHVDKIVNALHCNVVRRHAPMDFQKLPIVDEVLG
jgi:hypothetical protein